MQFDYSCDRNRVSLQVEAMMKRHKEYTKEPDHTDIHNRSSSILQFYIKLNHLILTDLHDQRFHII